jgi:hypothetical protein
MDEQLSGHHVVGLQSSIDVAAVDAQGDSQVHVLRSFNDNLLNAEQVSSLQGLEPEVVEVVISVIDDSRVESLFVLSTAIKDVKILNCRYVDMYSMLTSITTW